MAEFRGKQGHWVTTESGSHVFIESGKSFEEAISDAFGKENKGKYKKLERLEKLNGDIIYQTEDKETGDVLTFKSKEEAEKYLNDISNEDIMEEISDNDYYYSNLDEQSIYKLAAERLNKKYDTNLTPDQVKTALKKQGFDYEEYQKYLNGDDFDNDNDFENWDDDEFIENIDDINYDKAEKNEKKNADKGRKSDGSLSDEAFKIGQKGAKAYLDFMTQYNDLDKLKGSNIFLGGLQNAVSKAITEAGYNPNLELTYNDFNDVIGSVLGEEVDIAEYEQNATKGFTGKKYNDNKLKKDEDDKNPTISNLGFQKKGEKFEKEVIDALKGAVESNNNWIKKYEKLVELNKENKTMVNDFTKKIEAFKKENDYFNNVIKNPELMYKK